MDIEELSDIELTRSCGARKENKLKKYILAVTLVFVGLPLSVGRGDVPSYEQKPHLEIKCPCGASFISYEWLKEEILRRAEKFIEKHPCSHIIPIKKKGIIYGTEKQD